MKILRKLRVLANPLFWLYAVRRLASSFRWLLADYGEYRKAPPGLGPPPWRMDLACPEPGRITIHPAANIGRGAMLSAEPLSPADTARMLIDEGAYIGPGVELGLTPGCLLHIGAHTSMHRGTVILGNVRIGRHCILSYNIYIASGSHVVDAEPSWLIKDQDDAFGTDRSAGECVVIEDDVWLGWSVFVKTGVTIGRGCVVGSNAVVTSDLEPYGIYGGVPARKIRTRLAFEPPSAVSSMENNDLPYFYRGFLVDQTSLRASRVSGLVMLHGEAALILQRASTESALTLEGAWLGGTACRLAISVDGVRVFESDIAPGDFALQVPNLQAGTAPCKAAPGRGMEIGIALLDGDPRSLGLRRARVN